MPRLNPIIGRNLPAGHHPGGFSRQLGATCVAVKRRKKDIYSEYREIREAAARVLEKRPDVRTAVERNWQKY